MYRNGYEVKKSLEYFFKEQKCVLSLVGEGGGVGEGVLDGEGVGVGVGVNGKSKIGVGEE